MTDAYRWASAVARLARLRQHCRVHLDDQGLQFYFRTTPTCRCCSVPLCRERWLGVVAHGYEYELAWLLISEQWGAGVPMPPHPHKPRRGPGPDSGFNAAGDSQSSDISATE